MTQDRMQLSELLEKAGADDIVRGGQAARRLEQPRKWCHCRRGQHGHACKARVHARFVRIRALSALAGA